MKAKKKNKVEIEFELSNMLKKEIIRQDKNTKRKIISFCVHLATYPFIWLWFNIRDIKTFIIFMIVFLTLSCEIWFPYMLGFITWGSDFSVWCFGVGSACWSFWLLPGTPFLPLCIIITIGIKMLFDKIKRKS